MTKIHWVQDTFNGGELTPKAHGNTSLKQYPTCLDTLQNMVPWVQGPVTKRPGTEYIAEVKSSAKDTILVPFVYENENSYMLEFGDQYIRIFADGVSLGIEIATNYLEAELRELDWAQSENKLYIVHKNHAPRILTRTGHTSWNIADMTFEDGPYLEVEKDDGSGTKSLSYSAVSPVGASTTVTAAGFSPFASTDVGRFLRSTDQADCTGWGAVKITGYSSPTSVTAVIIKTLGASAHPCWQFGAYSDTTGYPSTVTFHQQRLVFGGGDKDKGDNHQRVFASRTANEDDFTPNDDTTGEPTATDGLSFKIRSDTGNQILWIKSGKDLFVGTYDAEFTIYAPEGGGLTPTNSKAERSSRFGSKLVHPELVGEAIIFSQRSGRTLRSIEYSTSSDLTRNMYVSRDITILADHLTEGKVQEIAYQQQPDSILWVVREDGSLSAAVVSAEYDLAAYFRCIIGGTDVKVISVGVVPSVVDDRDEVYFIVERTINGATKKYVEFLHKEFWFENNIQEAFFVDSGVTQRTASNITITVDAANNTTTGDTIRFNDTSASPLFTNIDLVEGTDWNTGASATLTAQDIRDAINNDATLSLYMSATESGGVVTVTDLTSTTRSKLWYCKDTVDANAQLSVGNVSGSFLWLATTTVTGLTHLEGETVKVLLDGATHPDKTVSSGSITLNTSGVIAHVGLGFTGLLKTLTPEVGLSDGSLQLRKQRPHAVGVRHYNSGTFKLGPDTSNLEPVVFRTTSSVMDSPVGLQTGDTESKTPHRWSRRTQVLIQSELPVPLTVQAIYTRFNANEP